MLLENCYMHSMFALKVRKQSDDQQINTVKISDRKVHRRNEILSFFTFWSVFKIRIFFLILSYCLQMFLGTLGGRSSCQKNFQTEYKEIVDNKFILVACVGQGQNWGQKWPNSEIWNSKRNITGRIIAIGQSTGL